jgi:hypothetical protein
VGEAGGIGGVVCEMSFGWPKCHDWSLKCG